MENLARRLLTHSEYLKLEREALEKSECYRGEIFRMNGANEIHNLVVTNLIGEISILFKNQPCKVYPSDMKVYIQESDLFTYPDVTIVCSKALFYDDSNDVLLNPEVVIEVLSPMTEKYDRGKKFELYRKNPNLKEYILVSTKQKKMESFLKQEFDWSYKETLDADKEFSICSLGVSILIDEVYAKVEMKEETDWK